MAIYYDKPYVWLQSDASGSFLRIRLWDRYSRKIASEDGYFDKTEEGETLYIIFKLHSGEVEESNITFNLYEASSPQYDPNVHNKVTIVITDESETILGFHTVMPVMGTFGFTAGSLPPYIPFAWLQFFSTDRSIVHIAADIPEGAEVDGPTISDDPEGYTRKVNFKVAGDTSGPPVVFHLEHQLDETNNFDPVMENIIINLTEYDPVTGGERKKGTGTVHTSEGDASGNG